MILVTLLFSSTSLAAERCAWSQHPYWKCLCQPNKLPTAVMRPWNHASPTENVNFTSLELTVLDETSGSWNDLPRSREELVIGPDYTETSSQHPLPRYSSADGKNSIARVAASHWPGPMGAAAVTRQRPFGSCIAPAVERDIFIRDAVVDWSLEADDYNSDVVANGTAPRIPLPVEAILQHEFGHVLGFDESYTAVEIHPETMMPNQIHGMFSDKSTVFFPDSDLHITVNEETRMATQYPKQSPGYAGNYALLPYRQDSSTGGVSSQEVWNWRYQALHGTDWGPHAPGSSVTHGGANADGPAPLLLQVSGSMPSTEVKYFAMDGGTVGPYSSCESRYDAYLTDGTLWVRTLANVPIPALTDTVIEIGSWPQSSLSIHPELTPGEYRICAYVDHAGFHLETTLRDNTVRSELMLLVQ